MKPTDTQRLLRRMFDAAIAAAQPALCVPPLMPPAPRSPLTLDQITTIKRWIDEGAKNDAGDVTLSGTRARVSSSAGVNASSRVSYRGQANAGPA